MALLISLLFSLDLDDGAMSAVEENLVSGVMDAADGSQRVVHTASFNDLDVFISHFCQHSPSTLDCTADTAGASCVDALPLTTKIKN